MFTISELIKATAADLIQPGTEKLVKDVCIDSRDIKPGDCFIAIKGNNFDGHEFIAQAIQKGAVCVVRTQGSRLRTKKYKSAAVLEVGDTIKALGNIAAFHRRRFNIPVIAVTGSNGKTTTKEMIAYVLSGKFRVLKNEGTKNNHIGVPMTLLGLKNSHDIAVLELGTNHFGEIKELAGICQPNIAVITNIASSHLEFLKDLSGVFAEKCSLLRFLRKPAIAILNADDGFLFKLINSRTSGFSSVSFGVNSPADFRGSAVELRGRACEFLLNSKCRFKLRNCGLHNVHNALSAIAAARIFGLGQKEIVSRLSSFEFPAGRFRMIKSNDLCLIDDTYNSNPFSLTHALNTLANIKTRGRKIFVMGDMLELGTDKEIFHGNAGRMIAEICDTFIAVGKLSGISARKAKESGMKDNDLFSCASAYEAGKILFEKIKPCCDDIVLVKGSRSMKMEEVFTKPKKR